MIAHAVTLPHGRTLWTRHGAALGALCLVYSNGAERPLPLRNVGVSLDALQYVAALVNNHVSATAPPEHDLQLTALADLDADATCARALAAAAPRGAPPSEAPEDTQAAALRAWSALGSESLAALAALPRLHSRRVKVTRGPSGLCVVITPDAAVRAGKATIWQLCTATVGWICIVAAAVCGLLVFSTRISSGAAEACGVAALVLYCVALALFLVFLVGWWTMWVPRRAELSVGPRRWRARAWLLHRGSCLRFPPFSRSGRGEIDELLGCQVRAQLATLLRCAARHGALISMQRAV